MRFRTLTCVLFLICAAVSLKSQAYAQQSVPQVLHGHVRPQVSSQSAALVSILPGDQQLRASIILPLRNQSALNALLTRLYDPSSPEYRHFLTVAQFTEQFGPTAEDFNAVVGFAQANGMTVTNQPGNRLVVPVSGSVSSINAAFHVQMSVYQHPTEKRTFFSPDREPSLNLATPVAHIAGLDNYSIPQPKLVRGPASGVHAMTVQGSGPGGSYLGSDMRAAYYGGTTLTGSGQAVGLVEFGGYALSDVNLTFSQAGQTYNVPINNVLIDGATSGSGYEDGEEVLDIVQAIGMAPGLSQVRVYIGTGNDDADILNSIATENLTKQVSCSWGWYPADPSTDDVFFQEMAAQGQSFFTASGDAGAYDLAVDPYVYPADDQYVITVGGTHLTTNGAGGSWASEVVWNSDGAGSGGGVSPHSISTPSWQSGVATAANGGSNTLRNSPDVAMEADFDNLSCENGTCYETYAGTSFAAPRWAGFMALVNQQAVEAGNAPLGGLGFINPTLYRLGESASTSSDFHDVTSGSNLTDNQPVYYNATTGYDLTTGWGSANGQALINDLAGPQVPGFFLSSSQSSINLTPGGTATATLSITPADGFTGNVTLAISGLPTGVTASFSPNPATGSSTVTFTASNTAAVSSQTVTITGTSGSLTASDNLTLAVHTPTFGLATSPAALSINQGTTGTSTVSVVPLYGFTGSVALSVSGLPAGVSASFSPASTTGTSMLTLTASSAATPGSSTLVVTGVSGSLTVTTNLTLTVTGPTFTLSAYGSVSVGQGGTATSYVDIYPQNGFTGSVTLAVSSLPAGVTASVNPNPATSYAAITFTASSTAATGMSTVTITGTSGSLTVSTTVMLGVYQPSFTINAPSSLSVGQGSSTNGYVYVSDQYGFSGAVTFSVSGLPKGATALWSPNPTTYNSFLVIAASSSTPAGTYPLTITGVSGSQSATAQLTLTVATPSFTLTAGSVSIGQGASGNTSVYVSDLYGFSGTVTLAASGLPSGVTASFSLNPTTGSSLLTLTASSTAALGQYNVTITGTSGSQTATTTLTLGVYVPTFTLTSYGGVSVGQGYSNTAYVYANAQYGFTGSVNLSVSGLPSGVTASFSPNPTTYSSALTISASSTAALGQYTLTVTGTNGTQTASTTVTLGVYKPGFTLYASGATVGQGTSSATGYAYVTDQYGFNGNVTLSASGLPSGVSVSFSPNPTTYSSTMTVTASSSVPVGTYTGTLNGVSGSLTASTTFTLTVGAPSFTISASSLTVAEGGSQSSYISVYDAYGFSGGVTLAASGLPAGVTATFAPNPTTGYSSMTLAVPASTPVGQYPFTVTGTSGSTVATANAILYVVMPSFTVYVPSSTLSLNQGASSSNYVYVEDGSGFSGSVTFSASGLPSGVSVSFATNPTTSATQFTLSALSSAAAGTYTITLTGTSGTITASTTITLTINAPGFTLTASPARLLLSTGGTARSTVTFTALNGFSGSVAYAVTGLPTGVTATIAPNPASAAAAITFVASASSPIWSGTVTVTGSAGSATATVPISLDIIAPATATTTTLAMTANGGSVTSVATGTAVTLTATVIAGSNPLPGEASAGVTPVTAGAVVFCDATATYCDPTHMIGAAQLTSTGTASYEFFPGMGVRSYKAVYAGTTSYLTSSSPASSLTVTASQPTTTTVAQAGGPGNYTLTATVSGSGAVVPTGLVSFLDTSNGNAALGSARLGNGVTTVSSTVTQSPTVGNSPFGMVTADFNGDGIPDLAVSNTGDTTISILLGNGDGTFQTGSSLALGTAPTTIVAGDFNHDGNPDLAVLRSAGGVFIFLGNGDGTFTPLNLSPSTVSYPTAMVVGDFNNDGVQDLAVTSSYSTPLTILLGNGDGTFTAAPASTIGISGVSAAATGDFNGDGIADLAVANTYSGITILLGNGDGSFTAGAIISASSYPNSIMSGDLNGDGKLDLLFASEYTSGLNVLLGNGDGTFTFATNAAPGAYIYNAALADFNGDGKPDIVASQSNGGAALLLLGNGDGTFATATTFVTATNTAGVSVADFNGDGIPDVALTNTSAGAVTIGTVQRAQKTTAFATSISPLGNGQHAVNASYAGDSDYTTSVSSTLLLTARPGPPSVTTILPTGVITTAQVVPVSITVSGGTSNAVPTGTVTLASGAYSSAAATLSGGTVTILVPAAILPAGTDALAVTYTPDSNSTSLYTTATASSVITVTLATPALTVVFAPNAPVAAQPFTVTVSVSGGASAPLAGGSVQFALGGYTGSATLSGGSATFSVPANTLTAGSDPYSASYTPDAASSAVYTLANTTGAITTAKASPSITWTTPASIPYGTALSGTQLNATAPVAGTFTYSPAAGTVLSAGAQTLSVTFTPSDAADYNTTTATMSLIVTKATPAISWGTPASISYGTVLSTTQLDATSPVSGTFAYTPSAGTVLPAGTQTLMVTFTPTDTTNYNTATATVAVSVSKATPSISWGAPTSIPYGTALSATQLNATSPVSGTFAYTPGAGTVLSADTQTLSVTLTPTDTADYNTATASITLSVGKTTPSISWAAPTSILYGTALSATQLDATSPVAGMFVYTPAAGTVLSVGMQTLSVTLTPNDTTDYNTTTATTSVNVTKATPTISWGAPASIPYGTVLSTTQLNATSSVSGTFAYTPSAGAVLSAGTQTLSVTFTPSDAADYNPTTATTSVIVTKATPSISWGTPASIPYGTALSATQLNATSSVTGTFAYTPAAGTVLSAGTQTLSVTFTPADTADYNTATATTSVNVTKVTPSISWSTPAAITYGTALSATQLNAGSTVAGTFIYTPAIGTTLAAGTQTLSATFTPNDQVSYQSSTATVQLAVAQAPLTIAAANATGVYGTTDPAFTGTMMGIVNGDKLTESFATSATSTSVAGTYPIVPSASGTALSNYAVTVINGTLTITRAASTTAFALSNGNLTFTATVTPPSSGVPTGSVSFYSGSTLLGMGTLAGGVASYTASAFPSGSAALSAVYSGDTNFAGSTSVAMPAVGLSAGSTSLTVSSAGSTQDTIMLSAAPGYTGTVQLACSGLPEYATCGFSPTSVTFGGSTTSATVTLTLHTGGTASLDTPGRLRRSTAPLLATFVVPALLSLAFGRRRLPVEVRLLIMLVLIACATAGLSGCAGGSTNTQSTQGTQSPATSTLSGTYTVQLNATGTSGVSQSINLNVTVQ